MELAKDARAQIDPQLKISTQIGGKGGKDKHNILKSNAIHILMNDKKNIIKDELDIKEEWANCDVVDLKNEIIIECGRTSVKRMLDGFNGLYDQINNVKTFRIMQLYDNLNLISNCYEYEKTKYYRTH